MATVSSTINSLVSFRNSQNKEGRGTLIHVTRSSIVFEVYNPYSIVQLSEVLPSLNILRGDRTIYRGKAVVSHILNTGVMNIISATLVDTWSDAAGLKSGGELRTETERFVDDWSHSSQLKPEYTHIVSILRNFLEELSRWIGEAEVSILGEKESIHESDLFEEFYQEVDGPSLGKINELFSQYEHEASLVAPEEIMTHKSFSRRELHPLTLCAPIVDRSYNKPLGFAGDYEMINMTLGTSSARGENTYASLIHNYFIETQTPLSNRYRSIDLQNRIQTEAERVINEERIFNLLNIGCGPALELQRFIEESVLSNQTTINIMDFNQETLDFVDSKINEAMRKSGNKPVVKFINKSIDDLLKEVHMEDSLYPETFDMIYCAGLFDYFSNHICKRLTKAYYSWIKPGGLVTITNVHPKNPVRYIMEHLLEWHLIYRDEKEVADLAPANTKYTVSAEKLGINIFLDIRK